MIRDLQGYLLTMDNNLKSISVCVDCPSLVVETKRSWDYLQSIHKCGSLFSTLYLSTNNLVDKLIKNISDKSEME